MNETGAQKSVIPSGLHREPYIFCTTAHIIQ